MKQEKPQPIDWTDYLERTTITKRRGLTVIAHSHWQNQAGLSIQIDPLALDLGAGAGHDSLYLVEKGFAVHAVDSNTSKLESLAADRLKVYKDSIETFTFADYELVIANYSLPFVHPLAFDAVIRRVKRALKPDGVFAGSFYGFGDAWYNKPNGLMTFLPSADAVKARLSGLTITFFHEQNEITMSDTGIREPRHVYFFVARK